MAEKKKISYMTYMRYKKEIDALYTMGYRYDMEKDPEKKAILQEKIIKKCDELKPKLGLKDVSDEEARKVLGLSFSKKEAKKEDGQKMEQSADQDLGQVAGQE